MPEHYNCGGRLVEQDSGNYQCERCGRVVRESVIERYESFKRVAKRDDPLTDVAQAALEGTAQ